MASRKKTKKATRLGGQSIHLKFRTRWRHVLLIDQKIRSGQGPNCRQLASELEVSRRTILRDIDFLRCDLGAPVEYDPARRGYVYTEPNWDMPSVRISEGELFALMVAEKALEAYAGTPWAKRLRQAFERMLTALPDRIEIAPLELLSRVRFDTEAAAEVDPDILTQVAACVRKNQIMKIRYTPLYLSEPKQYTIDPYVLRRARGAWYLAGRDRSSKHIPLFNLSRIQTAQPTGGTFDYDASGFDPKTYFADSFGVFETSSRFRVVVEFSGLAAQLVSERKWHNSQKLKNLPGKRVRFEVTVSHLDDIRPWLLSWGSEAKVVKPKELVETITAEAAGIAKLYSAKPTRKRK